MAAGTTAPAETLVPSAVTEVHGRGHLSGTIHRVLGTAHHTGGDGAIDSGRGHWHWTGGQGKTPGSSRKGRRELIDTTQVTGQPGITRGHVARGAPMSLEPTGCGDTLSRECKARQSRAAKGRLEAAPAAASRSAGWAFGQGGHGEEGRGDEAWQPRVASEAATEHHGMPAGMSHTHGGRRAAALGAGAGLSGGRRDIQTGSLATKPAHVPPCLATAPHAFGLDGDNQDTEGSTLSRGTISGEAGGDRKQNTRREMICFLSKSNTIVATCKRGVAWSKAPRLTAAGGGRPGPYRRTHCLLGACTRTLCPPRPGPGLSPKVTGSPHALSWLRGGPGPLSHQCPSKRGRPSLKHRIMSFSIV